MAYDKLGAFTRDFEKVWSKDKEWGETASKMVLGAWKIYLHGLVQGKGEGLTIGLIQNLKDKIKKDGSVFDGGKVFVDERHWKGKQNRWKIFLNDCFILGGVHSQGQFALVGLDQIVDHGSMVQKEGQLDYVKDPTGKFPLKVTQREVLGITSFGYSGGDIEDGTRIFTCEDATLANSATLEKYKNLVDNIEGALSAS